MLKSLFASHDSYPPLKIALLRPPAALEKGEDIHDFIVAQLIAKCWHARVCRRVVARADDRQQEIVGMMPGVTGVVMWRWRKTTVGQPHFPVGCTLQFGSMTGGAILSVETFACCYSRRVQDWQRGTAVSLITTG